MGILRDIHALFGLQKQSTQTVHQTDPTPKKKIFIVEDDPVLLEMYGDKFRHEGFTVVTATNGEEGLRLLPLTKPDLLILDLMMPVMDGKSMLRKLREIPTFAQLPVIVLTNAGQTDNIRETQRYFDAVEFLIKSNVDLDEIVKAVRRYI